jgi:hypothetical protein
LQRSANRITSPIATGWIWQIEFNVFMFIGVGANCAKISHWRFRTVNPLTIGGHVAFRYSELFDQTCAVPSEELARSCKSAKEQVAFGFTATVGGLNLKSETLWEILKPLHRPSSKL